MALKLIHEIIEYKNPDGSLKGKSIFIQIRPIGMEDRISAVTASYHIKSFLPYYIQEIEKIIDGSREKPLTIDIDPDLDYCIGTLEVHKEKAYASIDDYGNIEIDNPQTQTIETDQLLEFFKIMKKELGIGDEVVVDDRDA
jgi:hypothetical protein